MAEFLGTAQMRAAEQAAIGSGRVTGLQLMERAGMGVAGAILRQWPGLEGGPGRAVVLCGPGNNGGDGFVVARLLKGRGWEVDLFLWGDPERLPPDARANCRRWQDMGTVAPLAPGAVSTGRPVGLCVDALFGTGLTRPPDGALVAAVTALSDAFLGGARVVAVDVPSGLCADSGRPLGEAGAALVAALRPDLTVTFHRPKTGHVLADGPAACGRLVVAGIGLAPPAAGGVATVAVESPPAYLLARHGGSKFAHGHALVLAGGPERGGAARLAARGALRIGAGLVTVACPPAALTENAARLDAVMLREVADGPALARLLADPRIGALCLGPGLGLGPRAAELVSAALESGRPAVLDADALTLIARDERRAALVHAQCVMTPHMGEFARLCPDLAARLAAPAMRGPACSKLDVVREGARRFGCTLLLKGPDTVIADASGRAAIHSAAGVRAVPWLATAGAGDVLAGFIAGLLARGLAPFDAACASVWLHVECARTFGPGLIAEDLPEQLPGVLRALGC